MTDRFGGIPVDPSAIPTAGAPPAAPAAPAPAAPAPAAPATASPAGTDRFGGIPVSLPASDAGGEAAPPQDNGETNVGQVASQGLSGVNEGIAGMLSAPTNLVHGALALGPDLSNAIFGTKFSTDTSYLPDAGKTYLQMANDMGAGPRAPTSAPADQIARTIGQNVGGALVPEIGIEGDIAKGIMPAAGAVAKGLLPAVSAGVGGAVAQQLAPGNQVAQLAGELIGGVVPSTALSSVRALSGSGATLPGVADLTEPGHNAGLIAAKNAAYDNASSLGARYTPEAYNGLVNKIVTDANADNLNPKIHEAATAFIDQLRNAPEGFSPTLTQLDQMRQWAARDVMGGPNSHFGGQILKTIDDFIANATPDQMVSAKRFIPMAEGDKAGLEWSWNRSPDTGMAAARFGDNTYAAKTHQEAMQQAIDAQGPGVRAELNANPEQHLGYQVTDPEAAAKASDAILAARAANTRLSKVDTLDQQILKAQTNAGSAGSGGNINNALRQQLKPLLTNPDMARGLTPEETKAIVDIVMSSKAENAARAAGKMAPGGNGLMSQINTLGAVMSHGATLPLTIASGVAKHIADGRTVSKVADLRNAMISGETPQPRPFYTRGQLGAIGSSQAAAFTNPNAPSVEDEIKAAIMRRAGQ